MAINNFIKSNVEPLGKTSAVVCPVCGGNVCMPLYRSYDLFNPIALFKQADTQLGIAVCPECAGAFTVDNKYIDTLMSGQTVFITQDDLKRAGTQQE